MKRLHFGAMNVWPAALKIPASQLLSGQQRMQKRRSVNCSSARRLGGTSLLLSEETGLRPKSR